MNASKLKYTFKEGEKGQYVDITSLYPTVNYYDEYLVGHPEVLYKDSVTLHTCRRLTIYTTH